MAETAFDYLPDDNLDAPDLPWFIEARDKDPRDEFARQSAFVNFMRKHSAAIVYAVPNGGRLSEWQRIRRWREGVVAGALWLAWHGWRHAAQRQALTLGLLAGLAVEQRAGEGVRPVVGGQLPRRHHAGQRRAHRDAVRIGRLELGDFQETLDLFAGRALPRLLHRDLGPNAIGAARDHFDSAALQQKSSR